MNDLLHKAARAGNIEGIKELITKQGHDPNQPHSKLGTPPVAFAALNGHLEAMKTLVQLGARLDYDTKDELLPIWSFALGTNQASAIWKYLSDQGIKFSPNAAPTSGPDKGKTPLWVAANCHQWPIVESILCQFPEADVNAAPDTGVNKGITPLWLAACLQQWPIVKNILSLFPEADVNAAPDTGSNKGITLLWMAANCHQWPIVESILRQFRGINVNATADVGLNKGVTPLWLTAIWRQWPIMERILRQFPEADVNVRPEDESHFNKGISPLWLAAFRNQWDIILSTLETKSLAGIDLQLLKFRPAPSDLQTTVVQLAFEQQNRTIGERLFSNLLVRSFLLANQSTRFTRESLALCLQREVRNLLAAISGLEVPAAKKKALSLIRPTVDGLMQLFDEMGPLWQSSSVNIGFKQLPEEVNYSISVEINHSSLAFMNQSMRASLVDLFITSHRQRTRHDEVAGAEVFCKNIARLAFRAWRHEHQALFFKKSLSHSTVKDMYNMLEECFLKGLLQNKGFLVLNGENYIQFFQRYRNQPLIPQALKEAIINRIAALKEEDFRKSTIEKLIENEVDAYTEGYNDTINYKKRGRGVEKKTQEQPVAGSESQIAKKRKTEHGESAQRNSAMPDSDLSSSQPRLN